MSALLACGATDDKARLLSRLSRGCPGWALAAASDESLLVHRAGRLDGMLEALSGNLEQRFEYAAELSTRFTQKRAEVHEVLEDWLGILRDLLLIKTGMNAEIINLDYTDRLQAVAGGLDINEIRNGITAVKVASKQLWQNVSSRLVLDVMMLDMPVPSLKRIRV
jgi:DNA polymerase III gamma/tau subunit